MKSKHPPGPPMDLANMREKGVHHLIAFCHNDACRHQAVIDVSSYPADTPVPWFRTRVKCGKCGGKRVDVRRTARHADKAQLAVTMLRAMLRQSTRAQALSDRSSQTTSPTRQAVWPSRSGDLVYVLPRCLGCKVVGVTFSSSKRSKACISPFGNRTTIVVPAPITRIGSGQER